MTLSEMFKEKMEAYKIKRAQSKPILPKTKTKIKK